MNLFLKKQNNFPLSDILKINKNWVANESRTSKKGADRRDVSHVPTGNVIATTCPFMTSTVAYIVCTSSTLRLLETPPYMYFQNTRSTHRIICSFVTIRGT